MKPRSPSKTVNPSDASSLRIAGFGACMIAGYPHQGAGMFEVGCGAVAKRLSRPVQSEIVSLGGFPAPRAGKYLKKVFRFDPDYIVIQFGSSDAGCPIRSRPSQTERLFELSTGVNSEPGAAQRIIASQPATMLSQLRWQATSILGYLRKVEPVTPLSSYIAAIEHMVDDCRGEGIKPVVLSPFVYGSRYTMRKAAAYVDALKELHSRAPGMLFVDCVSLLRGFPKSRILQHDGLHLSQVGQTLVGEAIGHAIVEDVIASRMLAQRTYGG
jgi:lysophospholipase L1-like esterase